MDTNRQSKFRYLGLPLLFLLLYLVWLPSPSVKKIYIQGDLGYVAEGYDIKILRLIPPLRNVPIATVNFVRTVKDLVITQRYAYVVTNDGVIHIVDIGNPSNPIKLDEFSTRGTPQSLAVHNNVAYIAEKEGGLRIIDVRNSLQPIEVGFMADLGVVSDASIIDNLVYIARGEQGLDIYDMSNPAQPQPRGHYDAGKSIEQVIVEKTARDDGNEMIRATLVIAQSIVEVVDLTNAEKPELINSFNFDGAKIEQALLSGRRLFVAQRSGGLVISRVKNDGQLEQLAKLRPSLYTYGFALMDDTAYLATGFAGLQAFDISNLDQVHAVSVVFSDFWKHKIWVAILSFGILLLWLAFFSQFVLPVRTLRNRQKIFARLITYLFGGHGPALFIENGKIKEYSGERLKRGPGVLWLDSASAAVIRTAVAIKQTIGPGVHFIENHEFIAGTVDLHIQSHSLGPKESDKPFDEKSEFQSAEEYHQIQDRRKQVSALTRDGIEVIPRISVAFRVDTGFPKEGQPGSRFGYRKGITKKQKEREEQDKEAIRRAILGEGINPMAEPDSPRHRIAWNQLPVLLAVDIWREYVAKFTLDELFLPTQVVPIPAPQMPEPTEEEIDLLSQAVRVGATRETMQNMFASMLHEMNLFMARILRSMEDNNVDNGKKSTPVAPIISALQKTEKSEPQKKTALQVINEMVKARLTQPEVDFLDDHGVRGEGKISSAEYKLLQERGLKALSVVIGGLILNPVIEDLIISRWSTNWLKNAKNESEQIARQRNIIESAAREQAIRQYADVLSRDLIQKKPVGVKETLKTLLIRTRTIIFNNDQLRRRMTAEQQKLEEIIKWIEVNGL